MFYTNHFALPCVFSDGNNLPLNISPKFTPTCRNDIHIDEHRDFVKTFSPSYADEGSLKILRFEVSTLASTIPTSNSRRHQTCAKNPFGKRHAAILHDLTPHATQDHKDALVLLLVHQHDLILCVLVDVSNDEQTISKPLCCLI